MDAGLSSRADRTLKEFLPAAAPPEQRQHPTNLVDLSTAQNEVLRPELLEFFRTVVEDKVKSEAFGLPAADGGDPLLRAALASFFNKYFKPIHTVTPEHIVLTAGATDAIENVIYSICDDGDSVLVPGPAWRGFSPMIKGRPNVNILVAQPHTYDNWDNYLIPSLQAVYDFSADKSRIKAVVLCNPHNPLARCYPKKSILEVMEFCQEHGLHLIVDEIYALTDLNSSSAKSHQFVSALSLTEPLVRSGAVKVDPSRVHVVWSASKLFGMSGFRVGCIVSQQNPSLLSTLSLLTSNHVTPLSSTYLTSLLTWHQLPTLLNLNSERLTTSYNLLAATLNRLEIDFIVPTHGIFLYAKLARGVRTAVEEKCLYDQLAVDGVLVGYGCLIKSVAGDLGWYRIRFSVDMDVLNEALEKMEKVLLARK